MGIGIENKHFFEKTDFSTSWANRLKLVLFMVHCVCYTTVDT